MADRIFYGMQALQPNLKVIAGSFVTDGTNDPSSLTGKGFTVTHTATGKFTVTLGDKFPGLLSAISNVESSTAGDHMSQLGDIDVSSAKTIVIHTLTAGTAANLTGQKVHFCLFLRNTSIT
tara:strand:- start:21 stop:383 length:363 start_codon:yes stop_codon:yes gene_type:complete